MNKTYKNNILVFVVAVIIGLIVGYSFAPVQVENVSTSPAGTQSSTANFYSITVDMSQVATTSSILNTSSNDKFVTGIRAGCESIGTSKTYTTGSGLAILTLTVATSSTASPVTTRTNTQIVGGSAITISTSTANFVISSSTAIGPVEAYGSSAVNNIWASGSYMTFYTNATNTAHCTFGVDTINS